MRTKVVALAVAVAMLSGCATYRPVIDTKGVNPEAYNNDLIECQNYAGQVDPAGRAAAGAGAGALFGAIVGGLLGNRQSVGQAAAIYGLSGATVGAASGADSQMNIIRRCLALRGYRVLQ